MVARGSTRERKRIPRHARRVTPTPHTVRVRMYRVGFGDCFLVTLEYDRPLEDGRNARHLLIDFGSFRKATQPSFSEIAALIAQHCQGKLDVIVASHRDKDHIAGFADHEAFGTLRQLSPSLVVRPWTDHPSAGWFGRIDRSKSSNSGTDERLRETVQDRASHNLLSMGSQCQVAYLEAGRAESIERWLCGTEVLLLGPPGPAAWRGDKCNLNNTSLILLITILGQGSSKCLLFPGDAEIDSWSRALEQSACRSRLKTVDLYKIGHHGSKKATPLPLIDIWKESKARPRVGLLSTDSHLFGRASDQTEVPSRQLLCKLRCFMTIVSTEWARLPFVEVAARISQRSSFAVVESSP
jgi:hypothetical protein